MDDTIFKPLTHLDREGPQSNNDRFQRRDNTNFHDGYFQNADTAPTNPQEGWDGDTAGEPDSTIENNVTDEGCGCENARTPDAIIVETVVVEYYDEIEQ